MLKGMCSAATVVTFTEGNTLVVVSSLGSGSMYNVSLQQKSIEGFCRDS